MHTVDYPVKIHFPGCQCRHYRNKITQKSQVLVSPYKKEHFTNQFFVYDSIKRLNEDIEKFSDNCVCTYNNGKYNGGVIVISTTNLDNFCKNKSDELRDIRFIKFDNLDNCKDNSNLINKFTSYYPSLKNFYTLIGITIGSGSEESKTKCDNSNESESVENYTFPKGKLSFNDKSIEDCCFREFTEETGKTFVANETELQFQINKRKQHNIAYLPHSIIINNFYLRIIVV